MRNRIMWIATAIGTFLALYATPVLAVWRPGHP
jgi:hypothetical protein